MLTNSEKNKIESFLQFDAMLNTDKLGRPQIIDNPRRIANQKGGPRHKRNGPKSYQ